MIPEATKQSVIEMIKEGKTYAEMEEDLGISTSTMSKIKRDAILEGHIFPTTRGRKSNLLYPNQEAGPSSSSSPSKNPTSSNPSQPTKKRGRPRKSHAQTLANSTGTINPAATSTLQSQGSRPKKKLGRPPKHATGLQGQQNASSSASSPSSSSSSPIAPTNQVSGAGGGGGGRPKGRYAINEKEEKQLVRWAAGPNPINATEMAQRINKNKEKPVSVETVRKTLKRLGYNNITASRAVPAPQPLGQHHHQQQQQQQQQQQIQQMHPQSQHLSHHHQQQQQHHNQHHSHHQHQQHQHHHHQQQQQQQQHHHHQAPQQQQQHHQQQHPVLVPNSGGPSADLRGNRGPNPNSGHGGGGAGHMVDALWTNQRTGQGWAYW